MGGKAKQGIRMEGMNIIKLTYMKSMWAWKVYKNGR